MLYTAFWYLSSNPELEIIGGMKKYNYPICGLFIVAGACFWGQLRTYGFAVRSRRGATGITRSTRKYLKNIPQNPLDVRSQPSYNSPLINLFKLK
jgi:hypothetical protein